MYYARQTRAGFETRSRTTTIARAIISSSRQDYFATCQPPLSIIIFTPSLVIRRVLCRATSVARRNATGRGTTVSASARLAHHADHRRRRAAVPAGRCRARKDRSRRMRQYQYPPVSTCRRATCHHVVPVMLSWVSSGSSAALLDHGRQA